MIVKHQIQVRVRYAETDQMKMVYYGNYAQYYEMGRVEAIRALGMNYRELEEVHQVLMPVVHMEAKYIRPAVYDELIKIETTLVKIQDGFIYFRTEIFKEDGKLANVGKVKLCFLDSKDRKRIDTPSVLVELLKGNIAG